MRSTNKSAQLYWNNGLKDMFLIKLVALNYREGKLQDFFYVLYFTQMTILKLHVTSRYVLTLEPW